MLNVIDIKGNKLVSVAEFYDVLNADNPSKYRKVNYTQWYKRHITERSDQIATETVDFIPVEKIPLHKKQYGRGYKRKDFLITIDFLKELCVAIGGNRCKKIRDWANVYK